MQILITGAAGFLGGRLTKHLAALPGYTVRATSRRTHRAAELTAAGATFVPWAAVQPRLADALRDVDAVVHCAALSSPWGSYAAYHAANVTLTQDLLGAARIAGVQRFVHISSPSVYARYTDQFDVREDQPLPARPINAYAATKRLAETAVQAAHGPALRTLSLRPRAIIGAEDRVIFPRLMRAYHTGRLRIIGDGQNVVDFTSVHNFCHAIHLALRAPDGAYGQAYNISNDAPRPLWPVINQLLGALGHAPVTKRIPYGVADWVARLSEWRARRGGGAEPALTRYGAAVLARSFTMTVERARTQLGYVPLQTTDAAIAEFVRWWQTQER